MNRVFLLLALTAVAKGDSARFVFRIADCVGARTSCKLILVLRDRDPFSGCSQIKAGVEKKEKHILVHFQGLVPRKACFEKDPPPAHGQVEWDEENGEKELVLDDGHDADSYELRMSERTLSLTPKNGNQHHVAEPETVGELLRVPAHRLVVSAEYDGPEGEKKLGGKFSELLAALEKLGARVEEPAPGNYLTEWCEWLSLSPDPKRRCGGAAKNRFFVFEGDFKKVGELVKAYERYDHPHWKPGPYLSIFVRNSAGEILKTLTGN
jgi:hypothetical protein